MGLRTRKDSFALVRLRFLALAAVFAVPAHAQDATWSGNPANRNFNAGANWNPASVPGAGDTAIFGTSTVLNPRLNNNRQIGGILLQAGAGDYTLSTNGNQLRIGGAGISIQAGSLRIRNDGRLRFQNFATAGSALLVNLPLGQLQFEDDSSAGMATIRNRMGGMVEFRNRSTAANANITNEGTQGLAFYNQSTAGNATIVTDVDGGMAFFNRATAADATIDVSGFLGLNFFDRSDAGSALIRTRAGGETLFWDQGSGGNARFQTDAGGLVDFALSTGANNDGNHTAGSIAGAGNYSIGFGNTLTVGSNNLSTEVSGIIQDDCGCGPPGPGATLIKTGTGTLTLSGINTYTGPTGVLGGTLVVNGSIASSGVLAIGPGATVGGTGVLTTTFMSPGATLAPGSSIGTITVNGLLSFAPGSTYAVEIGTGASDLTVVTATAALNGADVNLAFVPGALIGKRYMILTAAGGLGGTTFGALNGSTGGFQASLSYDPDAVYLDLAINIGGGAGLTDNQRPVAGAITRAFDITGIPFQFAGLTPEQLTQVSGEITSGAMGAGFLTSDRFLSLLSDPSLGGSLPGGGEPAAYGETETRTGKADRAYAALLGTSAEHSTNPVDAAFASRWRGWGAVYGGAERVGGDPTVVGSATLNASAWGMASGGDYRLADGRVGFAFGIGGSTFGLANGLGSGNALSFQAGLHGSQDFGDAYISGALAYGLHATRTNRAVPGDTLSARFNAQTLSARAETGYRFDFGQTRLSPYAAIQATGYFLPAYAEASAAGGAFALAYGAQSEASVRTEVGARVVHDLGGVILTGRAAWAWNVASARGVSASFQSLPGQTFTVNGARPAPHALLLDAGLEAALAHNVSASVTLNGEFSRNVTSYGAKAKFTWTW